MSLEHISMILQRLPLWKRIAAVQTVTTPVADSTGQTAATLPQQPPK